MHLCITDAITQQSIVSQLLRYPERGNRGVLGEGNPITIFPAVYPIEPLFDNTRFDLHFYTDGFGFSVGFAHTLTNPKFPLTLQ